MNSVTRDAENRSRVMKIQRITGKSVSLIEKVIRGERSNELILRIYMELMEGEQALESNLVKAVEARCLLIKTLR